MSAPADARPEVARMPGAAALPRRSGELVFHADWERRAFALAVGLAERGVFEWREFQTALIHAVAEAEGDDPARPSRGYYESWLVALEQVMHAKGVSAT